MHLMNQHVYTLYIFSSDTTTTNFTTLWIPVNLIGKIFIGCIRDLKFNPRLYKKLISILV